MGSHDCVYHIIRTIVVPYTATLMETDSTVSSHNLIVLENVLK